MVKQKSTVEFSMVLPAKNLQILQNVRVLLESLCSGKSMISFACFACFHLPIASVVQNVNRNSNFPAESGCAQMIYLQNRMVEKIKSDLTWVCPFTVHKSWSLKYCSYISPIFGWLKIGLNVHDGPFFSGSHLHDPTACFLTLVRDHGANSPMLKKSVLNWPVSSTMARNSTR